MRTFRVRREAHIYDLSGFFGPIAIKDQIMRVCLLFERLKKLEAVEEDKSKVLVVGAGPAGMTAALMAARMNCETLIIERRTNTGGQLAAVPRIYCPTQYDWTSDNWLDGEFPHPQHDDIPVMLREGKAEILVQELSTRVGVIKEKLGDRFGHAEGFELKKPAGSPGSTAWPPIAADGAVRMEFELSEFGKLESPVPKTPAAADFDIVIVCAGFPKEVVTVGNFAGEIFWKLEIETMKDIGASGEDILLCGGGDGALQDFLALTTKPQFKTAKSIYQALMPDGGSLKALREDVERLVAKAEDQSRRKEFWHNKYKPAPGTVNPFLEQGCAIYLTLHDCYKAEVKKLLKNREIRSNLREIVTDKAKRGEIKIILQCSHFTACYSLNHILALLVATYLENKFATDPDEDDHGIGSGKEIIMDRRSVRSVTSMDAAHTCDSKEPSFCWEILHKVEFYESSCTVPHGGASRGSDDFTIIFVRFGIQPLSPVIEPGPAFPGTQLLPYSYP